MPKPGPDYWHPNTVLERFWSRVEKGSDCWIWTAGGTKAGYGVFYTEPRKGVSSQRSEYAHRYSWQKAYGPIPEGYQVCHHCDNPSCVRPNHLFLGDDQDNRSDMQQKGRGRGKYSDVTHCVRGHTFDDANTYKTPDGRRQCRICRLRRDRKSKRK